MVGRIGGRLDWARGRVEDAFDKTCTSQRATESGVVDVLIDEPCALEIQADDNQDIDQQTVGVTGWLVAISPDADVLSGDHLTIDGQVYAVIEEQYPTSFEAERVVLVTRV